MTELIPQKQMNIIYVDSEEMKEKQLPATNMLDGKSYTIWNTRWSGVSQKFPHEFQIDLGNEYLVSGFRYLPRQDVEIHSMPRNYEFYVTNNLSYWGLPVKTGTFPNSKVEQEVTFSSKKGKYVRMVILSEQVLTWKGTAIAEFNVIGTIVSVDYKPIPQSQMNILFIDSEATIEQQFPAKNMLDGNPNTFWNTEWAGGQSFPHEVQINLGNNYLVGGFRFLHRQDDILHSMPKNYRFYVANNTYNWGTPVITSTFSNSTLEQEIIFTPKQGKYVRLVILSEWGNYWKGSAIAEFNVLEYKPPVVPPVEPPVTPPVEPPVIPPVEPPVIPPVEPPVIPPIEPPGQIQIIPAVGVVEGDLFWIKSAVPPFDLLPGLPYINGTPILLGFTLSEKMW